MIEWNYISNRITSFCELIRGKKFSELTSFNVGGPAEIAAIPRNRKQVDDIMDMIVEDNLPYVILGNGTNVLVSDDGFDGIVVLIDDGLDWITREHDGIWNFGAGALLSTAIDITAKNNYGGLEALSGIPGTVGGAVIMNASAYQTSFFDRVKSIELRFPGDGFKKIEKEELEPGYRGIKLPEDAVIVSVDVELEFSSYDDVRNSIEHYRKLRTQTQPINERSAGCVFINPPEKHAGQLIDDAGLKGFTVGGAMVSEIHANYIINTGNATAANILEIIENVQNEVFKKFSISLELEIKKIGFK